MATSKKTKPLPKGTQNVTINMPSKDIELLRKRADAENISFARFARRALMGSVAAAKTRDSSDNSEVPAHLRLRFAGVISVLQTFQHLEAVEGLEEVTERLIDLKSDLTQLRKMWLQAKTGTGTAEIEDELGQIEEKLREAFNDD